MGGGGHSSAAAQSPAGAERVCQAAVGAALDPLSHDNEAYLQAQPGPYGVHRHIYPSLSRPKRKHPAQRPMDGQTTSFLQATSLIYEVHNVTFLLLQA